MESRFQLCCFMLVVMATTSIQVTSASICSMNHEVLNASSGSLKSPNYPNAYPLNTIKIWKIVAPMGERITLQFHTFALESHSSQCVVQCGCDYVKVRNKCSDENTVHTLCGEIVPLIVTSSDNELWIEFRSDESVNNTGFLALYTRASMSCPRPSDKVEDADMCLNDDKVACCDRNYARCRYDKLLTASSGTITSPGFPNNYPDSKTYRWRITVPQGYVVQINFTTSETEVCQKCSCDKVTVRSGPCDFYPGKYFCGRHKSTELPSYVSEGRHMFVTFTSNAFNNDKGFKANFRKALRCSGQTPVSCVVNGTVSCCLSTYLDSGKYTECTDSGFNTRSHCPTPKQCCISATSKPMCCEKPSCCKDLKPWSVMIIIMVIIQTLVHNPLGSCE